MNPTRLAFLINDTMEGINRSNLKSIYALDENDNVKRDCNGFPYYNGLAAALMQGIINSEIIKEAFKHEN